MFKNFADTLVGLCRTLEVPLGPDDLLDIVALSEKLVGSKEREGGKICLSLGDGLLGRFCEFLDGLLVVS